MPRAPFQILVIPFLVDAAGLRVAIFQRHERTGGYWQGIAGGGEDDETPLEAARREAREEAGLAEDAQFIALGLVEMIPVENVAGPLWGLDVTHIPEHAFAARVATPAIVLSDEHVAFRWVGIAEALELLRWESNRAAVREVGGMVGNDPSL